MRNHIRREAGNVNAAWWLVPAAFATAAAMAVATIDPEAPPAGAPPPAMAQPAAMPMQGTPAAATEQPLLQVSEHIQAF
jgi:hypothetical protein